MLYRLNTFSLLVYNKILIPFMMALKMKVPEFQNATMLLKYGPLVFSVQHLSSDHTRMCKLSRLKYSQIGFFFWFMNPWLFLLTPVVLSCRHCPFSLDIGFSFRIPPHVRATIVDRLVSMMQGPGTFD